MEHAPSADPILEPPTNNATWTKVVSRGHDGMNGSDGHDGVGLQFVEWSAGLETLSPEMLISSGGYLLMITNDVTVPNPGNPISQGLPTKHYKVIVRPGADGGTAVVYTNAAFIVDFDLNTSVPARSLVVWQDFLWYARQDYIPNVTPTPTTGPYWMCIGKQGERGPAGANGITNLNYMGAWSQYRTNEVNDIVRWTRSDGKIDWYRATGTSYGARPDINSNYWSKEITSGTDANTVEWKFVDGAYDDTVGHSNELHRMPDGKVWYSVGNVPIGPSHAPGRSAEDWRLFVKDGTSVASNTVWRGAWSQGEPYDPGDMVTWHHGGGKSLYICHTSVTNDAEPSNPTYWEEIVSGIQGATGAKGADGTATYITHTNIVTYENKYETNITTIVTNDLTTSIRDYDVPSTVYNTAKFHTNHFSYNPAQSTFTLTEAAIGVSTFNGWRGPVALAAGSNILFQFDSSTKTITILSTNGGTIANAWTTFYDSTGTTKTPSGESQLKIVTSTNHVGVVWGTPETIGTNTVEVLSIGLQSASGGGGSGVWTPTNRIVTAASDMVLSTDHLVWMMGETNQTLTLPDMAADSQTIVVRQMGNNGTSIIRGTNTWNLTYYGDGITIDWLGATTNWYWRAF